MMGVVRRNPVLVLRACMRMAASAWQTQAGALTASMHQLLIIFLIIFHAGLRDHTLWQPALLAI